MKRILKPIFAAALVVLMLVIGVVLMQKRAKAAQNPNAAAVLANRTPPPEVAAAPSANDGEALETPNETRRRLAAEAAKEVPSPPYPLSETVETLKAAPIASTPQAAVPVTPQVLVKRSPLRKKTRTKKTLTASLTGKDAIAVSTHWQTTRNTPAEGKDGRVIYSEGAGMPTVVCAPLRICIVELQAGEKLTGEPQIGDSVRWSIEPGNYGSGEHMTPLIVIKPKAVGLDTNLVITTDRRSYYLRLMSSAEDYVAKISFDYPDDSHARWSTALQKQAQAEREVQYEKGVRTLTDSLDTLNVDYTMKGDASIRPVRVLDDGIHTYIQMNPAVQHREAPILVILGPTGKAEMVNYRVKGSVYVVDRLFDRGRLILGSGRKAKKADIIRGSVKERRLFARDPFRGSVKDGQNGEGKDQ